MGYGTSTSAQAIMAAEELAAIAVTPYNCNVNVCGDCPVRELGQRALDVLFVPAEMVQLFQETNPNVVFISADEPLIEGNWDYTDALLTAFEGKAYTGVITNALELLTRLKGLRKASEVSCSLDLFRGEANLKRAIANMQEAHRRGLRNLTCSTVLSGLETLTFVRDVTLPRVAGIVSQYELSPWFDPTKTTPLSQRMFDPHEVADGLAELSEHALLTHDVEIVLHDTLKNCQDIDGITAVAQPEGANVFRFFTDGRAGANMDTFYPVSGPSFVQESGQTFLEFVDVTIARAA